MATVESTYFREKATQCRRLAKNIVGDPIAEALLRLAEEFDAKTAAELAHERAALAIGVGDGAGPAKPEIWARELEEEAARLDEHAADRSHS